MNNPSQQQHFIVTIGRQYGSGGRELGRKLAELLDAEFFDKQLLIQAAVNSGVSQQIFEHNDERRPSLIGGIPLGFGTFGTSAWAGSTSISDDSLQNILADEIRDIARTRSCVIVGRTADHILRNNPRCVNIFVQAPEESCIRRVMARGEKSTEQEARAHCRKINKIRAAYYNFYTDKRWGHASSYHLTVDSSILPIDTLAAHLAEFVKAFTQAHGRD